MPANQLVLSSVHRLGHKARQFGLKQPTQGTKRWPKLGAVFDVVVLCDCCCLVEPVEASLMRTNENCAMND